jgi:arylsulfatase A-like enzyme
MFMLGYCRVVPRVLTGLLAGVLCGLLSWPAGAQSNSPAVPSPRKPSIILILADDLGYGDLGCYGQKQIQTPNLDRMAREGLRFTSSYAGSTVCAPSRAALMLGQHTGHVGIRGNARNQTLHADEKCVAEVLQEAGYRTGMIGKWGLGDEHDPGAPQRKGFDEFVGYLDHRHAHHYYTDHLFRHDPGTGFSGKIPLIKNSDGRKGEYTHDLFTQAALNFIKNNKPDQFNRYRPFFLYLAYTIPHAYNEGTASGNGMPVPSDAPYSSTTWPQIEKNKAAMITRMDADIGQIMDKLAELKIEDNTIIFFSSDNGPHKEGGVDPNFHKSSGPLRGIKRDLYEGGIRVPLIARWPGKIKPGSVVDEPWAMWDILPSFAEIALVKPPDKIDGISFLPTLLGRTQTNRHDFFYWEFHERGFQQAVRMGDWKAVRTGVDGPLELYNLKTDIGEKNNVAGKHAEIVARIEEYLKTVRTPADRWPAKTAKGEKAVEPNPEKAGS